jgi:hypothetical protein
VISWSVPSKGEKYAEGNPISCGNRLDTQMKRIPEDDRPRNEISDLTSARENQGQIDAFAI